jgi:hypothetical protein
VVEDGGDVRKTQNVGFEIWDLGLRASGKLENGF